MIKLALLINLLFFSIFLQGQSVDLTKGLMAYYPFEGNANDASGNGNNGVLQGQTIIQSGIKGGAASFRGESLGDYITIPQNNIDTIVSISAWVKVTGFNLGCWCGTESIFSRGYKGAGNCFALDVYRNENPNCGEALSLDSVGFILEYSNNVRITTKRVFVPNQWYHVVGTYEGNRVKLYVNDFLIEQSSEISGVSSSGRDRFLINSSMQSSYGSGRLGGLIDEMRLYNRTLNIQEIEALFNDPSNKPVLNGPEFVCQGQSSMSYTVSEIAGAKSYKWTLSTGATGFSSTNNILVDYGFLAMSGTISVTGQGDSGDLETYTLGVTINALPATLSPIFGSATVCKENNPATYQVAKPGTQVSYLWTLPDGVTGSSTTNSISLTFSDEFISGKLKVRVQNRCGLGEESVMDIVKAPCKTIVYVTQTGDGLKDGTSWSNALGGNLPSSGGYTRLGYEMLSATSGMQFWIAEGIYHACTDNDREKSFELGQNVKLFGGFKGTETDTLQREIAKQSTIFSGNIGLPNDSTDNTKTILKTASVDWNTYSFIDGIDFIGGYNETTNSRGAGILNYGYISLKNSSFFNNFCSNEGGGLYSGNRILIEKCLFANNNAGWGGGMLNRGIADIRSSKFIGNSASYGGGISTIAGANMTLINSLVVNNSGSGGGGISTFSPWGGSTSVIINSTIANNSGLNVVIWWSNLKVYNSIIWGGGGVNDWYSSTTDFKNAIIQDNSGNPGVYNVDPQFLFPTFGLGTLFNGLIADWSLLCSSPAIGKGDASLIPVDVKTDIDGNPRIVNSIVDIGAYESQFAGTGSIDCPDSKGVNIEFFKNASPDIDGAPTNSTTRVLKLTQLGTKTLISTSGENSYRVRGYLIPSESGYYKFYLSNKSSGSFLLSTDSMEYHKKLVMESSSNDFWPATWTNSGSGTTMYTDSVLLVMGKPYYFEIMETFPFNTAETCGLRWALPESRTLTMINPANLRPAAPRMPRNELKWEIFTNRDNFNADVLRNIDSIPGKTFMINLLQTRNNSDTLDHFNSRIRGFIIPEVSGTYNFYFAADDEGQFWLSSDTSAVNTQFKSNISSAQTDWKQNISSQTLEAEKKYYFEILHHDSSGDDGIKLGWALQGDNEPVVISRNYLLGYIEGFAPQRLRFGEKQIYMAKGSSVKPVFQVFPWYADSTVTWKSSDPSVATVTQNGYINPIKAGDCRIIIQSVADITVTDTLNVSVTKVELELFNNSFTYDFAQLKDSPQIPDVVIDIESLERSNNIGLDYFSSRIRGYLIPPVSGDYTFYFACDDAGQFWLSPDTTFANAQLKSEITSMQNDWTQHESNQTLIAGQKYYFEVLHHEQTYTDLLKLGWKIPGKENPEVIATPYIVGWNGTKPVYKLSFIEHQILSFPKCSLTPHFELKPWNASNKSIEWKSTNADVASVNADGVISMGKPGDCKIIASMLENNHVGDTLQVTVTDYYGPYFVKENAMPDGKGRSWDDAIGMTKLFDFLNLAQQDQRITVLVAKGTYRPTDGLDRTKSFILHNGRMVGGFSPSMIGTDTLSRDFLANETILSGDIGVHDDANDNSFHVVATRGNSVLDGLTIRDGKASVSEYGFESGVSYGKRDDNGGGILSESTNTCLVNCRISNNSAINGGGGLAGGGNITIKNCSLYNNGTSPITYGGGMFTLQVNGYGGGIYIRSGTVHVIGSVFHDNGATSGGAIFLQGSSVNIDNSTFFNNGGYETIKAKDGSGIIMNNSTVKGDIECYYYSSANIKNSTISGSFKAAYIYAKDVISLDNTIITNYNPFAVGDRDVRVLSDSSITAKYCLMGTTLLGADKLIHLSDALPVHTIWLDSLSNNGGSTPTMKLKNVADNPAVGNGNTAYLGSADQRGALRTGSVSIGAYQLVNATGLAISPKQATLCSSGSAPFNVSFLPVLAIDSTYYVSSSDESVASVSGNTILAHFPGKVNVIVHSADGTLTDTCKVEVRGAIGSGTITGASRVFPGQKSVSYTVTPIDNVTSYIWTLPLGASGSSTTNTISVDFGDSAGTSEIKVRGENDCGEGEEIVFNFSFYGSEPRIYVTPNGSGTKNGSDWNNSLDGNSPAGNGYTRLSDLMRWSKSGTQFWIAEGTYKTCNDNDREKSFELGQGIKLFGGFQGTETDTLTRNISLHTTIFSGDIGIQKDSTDNSKIILKSNNSCLIDGIDFNGAYNAAANINGAAIVNYGILEVRNCNFRNNSGNGDGAGISNYNKLKVNRCLFYNNRTTWGSGGGICNNYNAILEVYSSVFSNNYAWNGGAGISVMGGSATIVNSLIVNNTSGVNAAGVCVWFYSDAKIYNSTIANNTGDLSVYGRSISILNSIIWGGGIALNQEPSIDFRNSIIQDQTGNPLVFNINPMFVNPTSGVGNGYDGITADWSLRWCSPALDLGDNSLIPPGISSDLAANVRLLNSVVDLGAYEFDRSKVTPNSVGFNNQRIYISDSKIFTEDGSSWSSALAGNAESCRYPGQTLLYEAMKDAKSGTDIWIKKGTYKCSLYNDRKHAFTLGSGVKVLGGFEGNEATSQPQNALLNRTIFSGEIGDTLINTDNSYHVLNINPDEIAYADTASLDGIIIEKGYADGSGIDAQGAGIFIHPKSLIKFGNMEISKNRSSGDGSGIFNHGSLKVISCKVNNNMKGSGIFNGDNLELINTTVNNNLDNYGLNNIGHCRFLGGSVNGNRSGIYNAVASDLLIEGISVSENSCESCGGVGGIYNAGTMQVAGCTIKDNWATYGGGIYNVSGGFANIVHTTVAHNHADGMGGGICNNGGILTVDGCMISNNYSYAKGGGLFNPSKVTNSVIVNNHSGGSGWSFFGGGIYVESNCQGIINTTVMNNSDQGIFSASGDSVLITNSIIFNNDSQIEGKVKISYSCIQDYSDASSFNTSNNPRCKNPSVGIGVNYDGLLADWSLLACSPCINAGDNLVIGSIDSLDAKGQTRLKFTRLDLGAIESQEEPAEVIDFSNGTVFVSDQDTLNGLGVSWGNAIAGNAPSCRYPGHSMLYQALKDVPQKCKIWVQGGIYPAALDSDRNKTFEIKPYTKLYGGFAGSEISTDQRVSGINETILSGNIGNPADSLDNSYHVMVTLQSIKATNDTSLIDHVSIIGGQADGVSAGGGLLNNKNNQITLRNCKLSSNGSGGGCFNQGVVLFEKCEITNNASNIMGGGIYNDNILDLKNCKVINNHLTFPGGGYWETWGGAGIFNSSGSTVKIDSSEISNNSIVSTLSGAGIMNHGNISFTHSKIENNNSPRFGGAIYSTGKIILSYCKINGNYSSNGAVTNSNDGEIYDCSFENNKAGIIYPGYSQGGSPAGIANSGSLKIRNSSFMHNNSNGPGGAIQNSGSLSVDSTRFEGNLDGITPVIQVGGIFWLIVVSPSGAGGAINNLAGQSLITNSIFKGNGASYGGAITNRSGKVSLLNCILDQNYSVAGGAAMLNHSRAVLSNCLIANNYSPTTVKNGGIITTGKGSNTKIINCTLANNRSDTNGFLVTGADEFDINSLDPTLTKDTVIFENSIIRGNGTTITNPNSALISMNYSNSDVSIPGIGNINSDPLFVNPTAGSDTTYNALEADWTLSACSPAINAGNDSIVTNSLDLAGNTRIYNRVDMGAYEMKFDNSIMDLHDVNTRNNGTTILWSRSVNPCNTIVFMKDTIAGAPVPVNGISYAPDSLYAGGTLFDGWHCVYRGNRSEVSVTGLTQGTTYRIAAFNYYPENSYGTPVLKNFKTVSPSVSITPHQLSICPDASQNVEIAIVPVSADDSSYTVSSSDESIASITGKTIYAHSPGKVNVIVRSADGTLTDTCRVEVRGAIGTGTITGPSTVCQGQNSVTYSVSEIENGTSYFWSLPAEVTGAATTNTITVDFGSSAVSGNISVRGHNTCGDGQATTFAITINPKPLPPVVETVTQPDCFVATGSAGLSGLPESGAWSLAFTPGRAATGGSGASASIDGLDPDTYMFTVTDSNGCVSAPSNEVFINTQPAPNQNKQMNVRVFLEGVFDTETGLMKTTLRDNALIPKSQPYSGPPWNYNGGESVSSVPSGVVDWVLVELRQAATPSEALPDTKLTGWPRAYFLKSDGTVVDLDGASLPTMGNPAVSGNLYVIVRHRNHLAIMSSMGITPDCDDYSYNFTDNLSKAHGSAGGYRQLVPGTYGMVSGDANSNGDISVLDFTRWATDFGQTGIYFTSDINGDSQVSVLDFTKWATNFGMDNISPLKGLNLQGIEGQSPLRYRSQVPGN